jgi:type III secretion protein HrpB1
MKNVIRVGMLVVLATILLFSFSVAFAGNENVNATKSINTTNSTKDMSNSTKNTDIKTIADLPFVIKNMTEVPQNITSRGNKLAFRTPPGGVLIPAGQSKLLGSVDVSPFSQIRVVADERVGSPTGVGIRLTITDGNELVAQLDELQLAPHSQVTNVYDTPGTKLTIFADAIGGTGSDGVDVLVYGS